MTRSRWLFFFVLLGLALAGQTSHAVEPDEVLSDPVLEGRARELSKELRCLVCQNQTIDESNAPLARDLRIIVRERLVAGDSDDQVVAFLVDRFGDYVRLKPPFDPRTYALWAAPFLLLLLGAIIVARFMRAARGSAADTAVLSETEQAELDAALDRLDERMSD